MNRKRKITLVAVFCAVLVIAATLLIVAFCKSKQDSTEKGVAKDAVYYCMTDDGEYAVSLTKDKTYILSVAGDYKYGAYTLSDSGELKLTVDGTEVSATINSDELALSYGGKSYTFLEKIERNVTFNDDGAATTATVLNGKSVAKPADPEEKEGKKFVGWYTSAEYKEVYNFAMPVRTDLTVYAQHVKLTAGAKEFTVTLKDGSDEKIRTTNGVVYGLESLADKDGKEFDGWYVSDFNDEAKLTYKYNGEALKQNVNLYPVWKGEINAVSVTESKISWESDGTSFDVKITDADNVSDTQRTTQAYLDYEFKKKGEYKVEISKTGSDKVATAFYNNKVLARVSNITVLDGGMLSYNTVDNAEKYIVTVECGNKGHKHSGIDNGKRAYFDISGCDMQEGGIKIVVVAEAKDYVASQSEAFYYDRKLGKIDAVEVKDGQLVWSEVENALGYVVTVNGESFEVGKVPGFSLKNYAAGEYNLGVYPVTKGYNSPAATTITYKKEKLATPAGVAVNGNVLKWQKVDGATAYLLKINGKEETVSGETRELTVKDFGSGRYATVSVAAIGGSGNSEFSDDLIVGYTSIENVEYVNGKVCWSPVFDADGYLVKVNDGTAIEVAEGITQADVTFDKAGENTISVEYLSGSSVLGAKSIKVRSYEVGLYNNGECVDVRYVATGDYVALPEAENLGYEFAGWYEVPDGGNNNASRVYDGTYTASRGMRLYASFTSAEYTVKLDSVGGTLDVTEVTVTYKEEYKLPVPVSKSLDKVFGGWYAEPNGVGQYTDGDGYGKGLWTGTDNDITLYAYWVSTLNYTLDNSGTGYIVTEGEGIAYATKVRVEPTHENKPVKSIDSLAGAGRLQSIEIPDTVDVAKGMMAGVKSSVFADCPVLEAINVYATGDTAKTASFDGVLYVLDEESSGKTLSLVPLAKSGKIKVMEGTTAIAAYAFSDIGVKEIEIPSTVTRVGAKAFENCAELEKVEFSVADESETPAELVVEDGAFANCANLTTMKLPGRLAKGEYTQKDAAVTSYKLQINTKFNGSILEGCNKLENVEIVGKQVNYKSIDGIVYSADGSELLYCPKGRTGKVKTDPAAKVIGNNAFNSCTELAEVEITFNIEEVGEFAFLRCYKLQNVVFGGTRDDAPLTIRKWAFALCYKLETLNLPENLYRVEFDIIHNSYSVKNVTLTSVGVKNEQGINEVKFDDVAFGTTHTDGIIRYFYVENLTVGEFVPEFAISNVFGGNLKTVSIANGNKSFVQTNGVIYSADVKRMLYCPSATKGTITIPDTVEVIGDNLFSGSQINSVIIPASVTTIGFGAFYSCSKLTTVTIADGAAPLTIGDRAFMFSGITAIDLPQRLVSLGEKVFNNCKSLVEVNMAEDIALTVIPKAAFSYCSSLTAIKVAEGITEIGDDAFNMCSALEKVELPSTLKTLGSGVFTSCNNINDLTIATGNKIYTTIDGVLYANDTEGKPDQLLYCPVSNGGDKNNTVNVPATVKNVASKAFYNNKNVKRIIFADHAGVDLTIGADAFGWASALTEVKLPDGITKIGSRAFEYTYIKELVIPKSVTKIEYEAFCGSGLLGTITFEEGEANLEICDATPNGSYFSASYSPFAYCYALKEVDLPARTSYIGVYSFAETNIERISIPAGVTKIGRSAFEGCARLTSIDLSKITITEIFDKTFYGCSSLREVKLPSSITAIGYGAFAGSAITSITIPETVIKIDGQEVGKNNKVVKNSFGSAFKDCTKLAEVVFEGNSKLAQLGNNTFYNCNLLVDIVLPESLTSVGNGAFYKTAIKNIVIPATVSTIGNEAFRYCDGLTSVTLSDGALSAIGDYTFGNTMISSFVFPETTVEKLTIGKDIFRGCRKLTSLHLSKDVTVIDGAFDGSVALENVTVADENKNFSAVEGIPVLFNKDKTVVRYVFGALNDETVKLAADIDEISDNAYAGQTEITTVVIPKGISKIGVGAFRNCTNLTTVIFEDGCVKLTELPAELFAGCSSLKKITLPVNATVVGKNAFAGCSSLEEVTMPGVEEISESAFENSGLKKFDIPANIYAVGKNAFKNSALTEISLGSVKTIGAGAFEGTEITSVIIPESVTLMGAGAFRSCTELKNVRFRTTSMRVVDDYMFYDCISLESIALPEGVTRLGGYAFMNCEKLSDVELPSTLETIAVDCDLDDTSEVNYGYTFANCTALKSIDLPDKLSYLGSFAFFNSGLVSIELPDALVNLTARNEALDLYEEYENDFRYWEVYYPENETGDESSSWNYFAGQFAYCQNLERIVVSSRLENIGSRVFWRSPNLTKIVYRGYVGSGSALPATLKVIAANAFATCAAGDLLVEGVEQLDTKAFAESGFTSITFGENCSFEKLKMQAFYDAKSLTKVILPDTVTEIGCEAFSGTSALKSLSLPAGVTKIDGGAFVDSGIKSIDLSGITEFGYDDDTDYADYSYDEGYIFFDCKDLASVTLGDSLEVLPSGTFRGCASLTQIIIPDSVTTIDVVCFYGSGLEQVYLSANVEEIGSGALASLNMKKIEVDANNSYYSCVNGFLIEDGGKLVSYADGYGVDKIVLPEEVTSVAQHAFANIAYAKEVEIPSSLKTIPRYAFENATALESVIISEGVTKIDMYAFQGCSSLETVQLPESLTSIGSGAFRNCVSLKNIVWPSDGSKLTINSSAFSNAGLERLELPTNIKTIQNYAFSENKLLESVKLPENLTATAQGLFNKCVSLKSIEIPESVTSIGFQTFTGCSSLSEVKINGYVKLGANVFLNCTSLENFDFSRVTSFSGSGAFKNTALKEVILPDSITQLYGNTFENCKNLEKIVFGNNLTTIDGRNFVGCEKLKSIEIPASVTQIKASAFAESGLESVTLKTETCTFGVKVFADCASLKTVTLADSVKNLGKNMFENCTALKEIIIPSGIREIPDCAFRGSGLETISLTNGVNIIGAKAFADCKSLKTVELNGVGEIRDGAFANCTAIAKLVIPDSVTEIIGNTVFAGWDEYQKIEFSLNGYQVMKMFGSDWLNGCNAEVSYS